MAAMMPIKIMTTINSMSVKARERAEEETRAG
jgi:hypothetical protein